MLYILDQRLRAQNVLSEKASKVMLDITCQMFNDRCVKEIFKAQEKLLAKRALKTVFERLAHASIMKLNSQAMDKLFDLMAMAVKYQVLLCKQPEDVILVTLNHLDAIREFVSSSEEHVAMVNSAARTFTDFYSRLTPAQFLLLRSTLLNIFQDTHKRVSIFLKHSAQLPNGRFVIPTGGTVPHGFDVPGTIKYYHGVTTEVEHFSPLHSYDPAEATGSWEVEGKRGTTLGQNIYAAEKSTDPNASADSSAGYDQVVEEEEAMPEGDGESNPLVKAELDLLERLLMTVKKPQAAGDTFKLKLFTDSSSFDAPTTATVVRLDLSKKGSAELSQIVEDFTDADSSKRTDSGDDLLDLMDQVG